MFAGGGFPYNWPGIVTAGNGYTSGQEDTGTSRAANEAQTLAAGPARGTFTLSQSTNWSAILATFSGSTVTLPVITTSTLPNATVGTAYSSTVTATGGTASYTWTIASGALPAGLSLNAASGIIAGTPSGTGTASFTIQVKDADALAATQALTILVQPQSAIRLIQSNKNSGTSVTSVSVALPGAITTGNLIVAFVRMSSANQTVSLTDSLGNSYVDAVSQIQTADGHQTHILYAKNVRGGAATITATFSGVNNHPFVAVYEYAGLSALDASSSAQGNSAAAAAAPLTIMSANELIFAGAGFPFGWPGSVTAGSGYTLQLQDTGTSRGASETTVAGSSGTITGTFGLSQAANWTSILATFK